MTQTTPLTRSQLTQLTQEYQKLEEWTTVRDFCAQAYGPDKAVKVEIETYGEYNDEGGTNYYVQSITAYDAQNERLAFDLSLPFWEHLLKKEEEEEEAQDDEDDAQDRALDALKDWYPWEDEEKALVEKHRWIKYEQLPHDVHNGGDQTYDLTKQPEISFPVVVAAQ